jgi:hypothetical protein
VKIWPPLALSLPVSQSLSYSLALSCTYRQAIPTAWLKGNVLVPLPSGVEGNGSG